MDLDLNQFHEFIRDRKCLCFGSGIQGFRFIGILENWNKSADIIAFVDNAIDKCGQRIHYENYSYPIISMADAQKLINDDIVIIITCADIITIKNQLDQYEELNDIYCFSLVEIGQQQLRVSNYDKVIIETDNAIIPKTIHYCWLGGTMPDMIKRNIENWHLKCPDYQIIKWDESNYDVSKNQYMLEAYEMKKWGFVPDYMRLDIVYQHGGIYLDTDVEIVKRPDDLLYQDGFINFDSSLMMNLGSGFGARPGLEIIKELRDYYDNVPFRLKDGKFDNNSCMIHSYNVLKKYNFDINDSLQRVGGMNLYPMIIQGTCAYTKQMRITDKTYFLHYGTTTWLDDQNNSVRNNLGDFYKNKKLETLINYTFK